MCRLIKPLFTAIPPERGECWDRLARFAEFWHKISCSPIDFTRPVLEAETRLHITIPTALIEWHARFGRFINLWSDPAFTIPINRLHIQDGKLIVRSEKAFNGLFEVKWGIPLTALDLDDPPVVSIFGSKVYPCADRLSHFAIYCAVFDTCNSLHMKEMCRDNEAPFPPGGKKMFFPDSFGVIKTEMYEGDNWIAMVSGTDWYVIRRNIADNADVFTKHELRTGGLRP